MEATLPCRNQQGSEAWQAEGPRRLSEKDSVKKKPAALNPESPDLVGRVPKPEILRYEYGERASYPKGPQS